MDLVSLDPASLEPDGTVTAQVEVTNTSSQPLTDMVLELRGPSSRVTVSPLEEAMHDVFLSREPVRTRALEVTVEWLRRR